MNGDHRPATTTVFARLFALATLFYHAQVRQPFAADWPTLAFVLALAVLVVPRSFWLLTAFATAQAVAVAIELPETNTNRLLEGLLGLAIGLAVVMDRIARGHRRASVLDSAQPALQATLIVVYFWAFFHKMNWGFLTPLGSCGAELATYLPVIDDIPAVLAPIIIWGTIIAEAALGVLLVFPATQWIAVRFGIPFHFVLGVAGFYSFSATMIALLSLSAGEGRWRAFQGRSSQFAGQGRRVAALAAVAVVVLAALLLWFDPTLEKTRLLSDYWDASRTPLQNINAIWNYGSERGFYGLFAVYGLLSVLIWLPGWMRPAGGDRGARGWRWRDVPMVTALVPILTFVNGAVPYLGGKTEGAFAMYSNLRTEPGFENHVLVPTVPLWPYQSELVWVEASSDPRLQYFADEQIPVPLAAVRKLVQNPPSPGPITARYRLHGTTHTTTDAATDGQLGVPLSVLERKFLRFREIRTAGCAH